MVKFISYDGKYPNLCSGVLVLDIDSERIALNGCLVSGGSVTFTKDWDAEVCEGEWGIRLPEQLEKYRAEILKCVNGHIPYGCCGGCI